MQVLQFEVIDKSGTAIWTTHRIIDPPVQWKVGDRVQIPLSSGDKAVASISGMQFRSGAGAGPERCYLILEFERTFLRNVERDGELVNLDISAEQR